MRWRAEHGFTYAELLVVLAIVGMVTGAIVGFYISSEQIYGRAASLEDAQVEGRANVDRMAADLRLIGAFWVGATGAGPAIATATPTRITFLADFDGDTLDNGGNEVSLALAANQGSAQITVDRTIGLGGSNAFAAGEYVYVANGVAREVAQIAAGYAGGAVLPLATPLTNSYPPGSMVRSVETVAYDHDVLTNTLTVSVGGANSVLGTATSLTLTYFGTNGTPLGSPPNVALIREIQVSLTTQGPDGSGRVLITRVSPPNLNL